MSRYIVTHAPAYKWFILDTQDRFVAASGFATQEAAEHYIANVLTVETPPPQTWTVVRDEDGIPIRLER